MGLEWLLNSCFQSETKGYQTGICGDAQRERSRYGQSTGNTELVRSPGAEDNAGRQNAAFTTDEWIFTPGGKGDGCENPEPANPATTSPGGWVSKCCVPRPMKTHRARASSGSPADTSAARSLTGPEITATGSRQCDAAGVPSLTKDGEYGFAAYPSPSSPPVLQELVRQQKTDHSHLYHDAFSNLHEQQQQQQLRPQVYMADEGVGVPTARTSTGGGSDGRVTTSNLASRIRAVLHSSTPIAKREVVYAFEGRSQLEGKSFAPLPPRTLVPPHQHLPAQAQARQKLTSMRPRTAPTGSVCNRDCIPLMTRLGGDSESPQAGSGTGAAHSPKMPVDVALTTTCTLANRSFGTNDLQLASSPLPGSSVRVGSGGQGMMCLRTGFGPDERTLSDMPGLDRRTAAHFTVLCNLDPTPQPLSSNLPSHVTGAGVSSCSGGPVREGSSSTGLTAAAAAMAAAERELGLIRASSLKELSGQLDGLRWLVNGSSGRVFTGLWKGSPVAVKVVLSDTPDQLLESSREALLSRVVSHPAICQCYTVCSEAIAPEHLQLPRLQPRLNAVGNHRLGSSLSAVDTQGCMLPTPSPIHMRISVSSRTAGAADNCNSNMARGIASVRPAPTVAAMAAAGGSTTAAAALSAVGERLRFLNEFGNVGVAAAEDDLMLQPATLTKPRLREEREASGRGRLRKEVARPAPSTDICCSNKNKDIQSQRTAMSCGGDGGGSQHGSGNGAAAMPSSIDHSSRGGAINSGAIGMVSSLIGWGCEPTSPVSDSSLLSGASHGSAVLVGENRRCVRDVQSVVAAEATTTLSLSELLRWVTSSWKHQRTQDPGA
ncbi:hypothetical protein Vretifemale_2849 [Volvox reticuliferus]|uniref:Protein kinase domain-containing protein n=1 Tax=Volvox reticuliferus TaxID=1737510 RepID=A0A8J4FFD9_9CHLO|nr:hypothetical protein Vretifemale_2849 [Volvox reticuliferus]